jgi:hypothetical protein
MFRVTLRFHTKTFMLANTKRKPNVCNCVSMVCSPINYWYRANNLRKALDTLNVSGYMDFI